MPMRPPVFRPAHLPSREAQARAYDARRTADKPWRRWYWTARWRRIAKAQLATHPLCAMCERDGRVTAATVCDHAVPHRGHPVLFWNGPFESLCDAAPWRCHSSVKQREEREAERGGWV